MAMMAMVGVLGASAEVVSSWTCDLEEADQVLSTRRFEKSVFSELQQMSFQNPNGTLSLV